MIIRALSKVDRQLRSIAYDVLSKRDGQSGWKSHRDAFLKQMSADRKSLGEQTEHKIAKILNHAYTTSAYYRNLWDAAGIHPSAIASLNEFRQIPFLTKDIIKEHKSALVSQKFPSNELHLSYTGGTTGTQTSFYFDHACKIARVGRRWGMHELCGYRPGARRGLVW